MRLNNLLCHFRSFRFKSTIKFNNEHSNVSTFNKKFRRKFIHDTYFDLEDNYKRLSRSSKISYYALGVFLLVPSGLAIFAPASSVYLNVLSHHFKMSSMCLAWLSSNLLAFDISKFYGVSFLSNSRGIFGLIFALIGVGGCLIIGDFSLVNGYYTLTASYLLFGLYNFFLLSKRLLPRCIFIPSSYLILLNLLTIISCLIKTHLVKYELTNISDEEIIKKFESSDLFKKNLKKFNESQIKS